jgi:hypothetical protein
MAKDNYRLEYNETQGAFNFDDGSHKNGSFGWITICGEISAEQAAEFIDKIDTKYPSTNWMNKYRQTDFPSLSIIQAEFKNFLLTSPKS